MAELLDSKDVMEFKELLMANTVQIDAMYQLLMQKGFFFETEYLAKMKEVQAEYQKAGQCMMMNHSLLDCPDFYLIRRRR